MPNTLKVEISSRAQWDKEIKAARKKQFSFEGKEPKFAGYTLIVYHVQQRIMTPLMEVKRAGFTLFPNAPIIKSIGKVTLKPRESRYKSKIQVIREFDDMHQLLAFFKKFNVEFNDNKIYSAAKHKGTYKGCRFSWTKRKIDFVKADILSRQLELEFEK